MIKFDGLAGLPLTPNLVVKGEVLVRQLARLQFYLCTFSPGLTNNWHYGRILLQFRYHVQSWSCKKYDLFPEKIMTPSAGA